MTPQERDLVTALLARLKQQGAQAKDPEAEALIRQAMTEQPDAPYYLAQTVLMQDLALQAAQERIHQLEAQAAPARASGTSFLGGASRGTVPTAGPWTTAPAAPSPRWSQSGTGAPPSFAPAPLFGGGSGFLQQAAATAAGVAGGALLFQGISSLFGPHWGGAWAGGMPMAPSISETVVNNYYDQGGAAPPLQGDAGVDDSPDLGGTDGDLADGDFTDGDDLLDI